MKWIPALLVVLLLFFGALYMLNERQKENAAPLPVNENPTEEPVGETPAALPLEVERAVLEAVVTENPELAAESVVVIDVEESTFSNGCLGLAREGEMCTQALVEGYAVFLRAGSVEYVYRSNLDGSQVRLESRTTTE